MKNYDAHAVFAHLYGGVTFLVALWIYIRTLAPTVSFFDSGELISAAYTLGIAHPPGYPLYVLLGWFFSKLPFGNAAWRINLMSAFFGALASLMVYYITYTILPRRGQNHQDLTSVPADDPPKPCHAEPFDVAQDKLCRSTNQNGNAKVKSAPEHLIYPVIAMAAALSFAFSLTHWRHAVIAEVYSLNAFLCGLIMFLLFRWRSDQLRCPEPVEGSIVNCSVLSLSKGQLSIKNAWLLYLTALVFGLGFGNHQTISLFSIAACFIVLITRPKMVFNLKSLMLILVFFMLGLSIYAFVPIRAAQNPPINWGKAVTWRQFRWLVMREGYRHVTKGNGLKTLWNQLSGQAEEGAGTQKSSSAVQKTGLARISHIFVQSLFWKQLKSFHPLREFGSMGCVFVLLGVLYGLFAYRIEMLSILLAVGSFVLIVVLIGDAPEEHIFLVEEFHTPVYLLVAVCLGIGAMALVRAVFWLASKPLTLQYVLVFGFALYFLVLPGAQMLKHIKTVDRRRNYVAYDYASNVLSFLEPNAILFTWGDSGAFPLWYLQIVEKKRPDVLLIHVPHLGSDWFVDELPKDLFSSSNPYQEHEGDMALILHEIVQNNIAKRPIYFDFSGAHSLELPYPLLLYGIVFKAAVAGDTFDEDIWSRYRLRGILDDTLIARDPDIDRTFYMYGAAHMELGHYYLERKQFEKAAQAFEQAVQFEPSFFHQIEQILRSKEKPASGNLHISKDSLPDS